VSGAWSGAGLNRTWHPGGRPRQVHALTAEDRARGARLFAELADVPFYCETCHGSHPLSEHKACREGTR
jgi:hypothetical protein